MKNIIFISAIILLTGCSTRIDSTLIENGKLGHAPSIEDMSIIKNFKDFYLGKDNSRSLPDQMPFSAIREIDSADIEVLPYYDFDEIAFYKDPSPENIIKNLSKSKDAYFSISSHGKLKYRLILSKQGEDWKLRRLGEGWDQTIGWLSDSLSTADSKEYKIFRPLGLEYVLYYKNGEPVFCLITGERRSGDKLCETFVEMMNNGSENSKYLKEQELLLQNELKRRDGQKNP